MCNEMSPMHIMNDTCTQLHTMRVVFFYASVHTNEKARKGQMNAVILLKKKQRWRSPVHLLLDRTSPPSCTCMVVETPEAAIQSVRPQTRAGPSSHCRHTTARPGHALRPVEKKRLICKMY